MFTAQEAINRLCDKREIFYDEMVDLMRQVMEGKVTPVQLSAILMGLHVKSESVSEIAAAAFVMREFSTKVDTAGLEHLVCLLYTSPSPRDRTRSRMPSSA